MTSTSPETPRPATAAAPETSDASGSASTGSEWWRTAVIYQIYPRSFADSSGDGIGDLPGITDRLPALKELGVDAIWLSPFSTSPQADAGYDVADYCDVDPLFGTLADFDAMVGRAHGLGLRVIVDIVPNHSSDEHPWFQEALAAAPGSPERARYLFRDGKGAGGDEPPNNWPSVFGGSAWDRVTEADGTPGQWYLHLFDRKQPDFDWTNPEVHELFHGVLRFWLNRGVDGFRIDVATSLYKKEGLPDLRPDQLPGPDTSPEALEDDPRWARPEVHAVFRDWRRLVDEYPGERMLTGEAWIPDLAKLADWVRPDELHQTFNFPFEESAWDAEELRAVIDESLGAFGGVGAPSTWVLSNHDVVRHATRLAMTPPHNSLHADHPPLPDRAFALRRARAATALMLALPGSAYLYQGEELGLPEVVDLPDAARQDPSFARTGGEQLGRDGCRVPIPWESDAPAYGFSPTGASWLPQPELFGELARSNQAQAEGSTLDFYRSALTTRTALGLGSATLTWSDAVAPSTGVLEFRIGDVTVVANASTASVPLPGGEILLASGELPGDGTLPSDTTVWIR